MESVENEMVRLLPKVVLELSKYGTDKDLLAFFSVKLIRSDFEAVVVEIGRHFLPDRKEILNKTLSYS